MGNSMYFGEFAVGGTYHSPARTITEADLTFFSMMSGDWNALHSDAVQAASSPFGRRVVHGAFGIALVTGLMTRIGIFDDSAIALLDFREWSFCKPVFIGDTLHIDLLIYALKPTPSGGGGVVDRHITLINQDGITVQAGYSAILVADRPTCHDPEGSTSAFLVRPTQR
jgi:acyl dehydratase